MNTARNRSSTGMNRANLRSAPAQTAPPPRALPAPAVPYAAPSALGEGLQIVGGIGAMLVGLALLLLVIYKTSDSMAVGKHLAEAKAQRSTLICQDGRMVHGDGSLRDRLVEDAFFVCTDWRTLQSVEQETPAR